MLWVVQPPDEDELAPPDDELDEEPAPIGAAEGLVADGWFAGAADWPPLSWFLLQALRPAPNTARPRTNAVFFNTSIAFLHEWEQGRYDWESSRAGRGTVGPTPVPD